MLRIVERMKRAEKLERDRAIRRRRKAGLSERELAAEFGVGVATVHRALNPTARPKRHPEGCTCTRCTGFQPGHQLSVTHGARSQRLLRPIAQALMDGLYADPTTPPYLHDPSYGSAVQGWAYAEAECYRLRSYIDEMTGTADTLTERVTINETVQEGPDGIRRRSVQARIRSAQEALDRAERRADKLRSELGLTPLSRARLGKDISVMRRFDLTRAYAAADAGDQATLDAELALLPDDDSEAS